MNYKIPYKKENRVCSAGLENVMLRGEIGIRCDRFSYERVWGEFARKEILREAENCFFEQYDDEFPWGLWRCEFWGKLMISAVRVCRMRNDPELRDALRASAYRILEKQETDGYLSSYRRKENVQEIPLTKEVLRDAGWACTWNWNVWGQKYTLWGLLEIAQLADDGHLLSCADRLASCLLDTLDALGLHFRDCGVMDGMPPCSILKPMLILYRLTGNERYLKTCLTIADDWEREDGSRPNLIANALSGVSPKHWYEDGAWCAKAYEMMSCFDGLCELYRVTGTERYLDAAKGLYEELVKYESNILGSVGYCEHFDEAVKYPDAATEVCDAVHWMRLCYELFSLTGEAKYMESFESAFLNAFLAGIYEDGKSSAFFVRSAGRHWIGDPQVETMYQHCCANNLPRGYCNAAEAVVMKGEDGYYVNSYIPARAVFGAVDFKLGGGYLDSGAVSLTVRGLEKETAVFLRIPAWSAKTTIMIGDGETAGTAGGYTRIVLPAGDTVVRIRFDMTPRILDFAGTYTELPRTDYHVNRWVDAGNGLCDRSCMVKKPMSTLRRGALIYARSKRMGSTEEELFSGKTVWGGEYACTASVIRHSNLLSACRVTFAKDGETFTYVMCDYASAANCNRDDPKFFNVMI